MNKQYIFDFKADISSLAIPKELNNPFEVNNSEIAHLAAEEFQEYISGEAPKWGVDFSTRKGKMFGVLVAQKPNGDYCYLGSVSGKLPNKAICERFTPSVFDESTDNFFMVREMTKVSQMCLKINGTVCPTEREILKEIRKNKSNAIQRRLFENYIFLNLSGKEKSVLDIFEESSHGNPPAAAGECAAPKMLNYALKHGLTPIAINEFWWGCPIKTDERQHKVSYPACKNKCRPILEYMLEDTTLYSSVNRVHKLARV